MSQTLARWMQRLEQFVPNFVRSHPFLRTQPCAILLHGSTTFGIDDPISDIDLWLLISPRRLAEFDRTHPTRFLDFKLDEKPGHFSVESRDDFANRITRCDLPLIAELRWAQVVIDHEEVAQKLLRRAAQPMRDEVRHAWLRYHYVEFRGDHRACISPIERGLHLASLIGFSKAIEHALRAACVADSQPYHYSKWLATMAAKTPTGAKIAAPAADRRCTGRRY